MSGTPTQRNAVRRLLRVARHRGVTTAEFLAAGIPRFSGRLLELRDEGYVISTERIGRGKWRYTLISEPDRSDPERTPLPPAADPHEPAAALFADHLAGTPYGDRWS